MKYEYRNLQENAFKHDMYKTSSMQAGRYYLFRLKLAHINLFSSPDRLL